MYSTNRHHPGKGALLAVLQAILLLSMMVLTPAASIARQNDPASDDAATAPVAGQREFRQAKIARGGLKIRTYPQRIKIARAGSQVVSAWLCPENDKTPFSGGDPNKTKHDCVPVRVDWTLKNPDDARLSSTFGFRTRVTMLHKRDNRLTATSERFGIYRNAKIIAQEAPAKRDARATAVLKELQRSAAQRRAANRRAAAQEAAPQPQAQPQPKPEPQAQPAAPKAEETKPAEPKAEEPTADEPKADEPKAEESAAEPVTEAPADEPKADEPKAEESAAEPVTEAPAEEPVVEDVQAVEEPVTEEPKDNGKGNDEPKDEETKPAEPKAEEPTADEPKADEPKAEETKPAEPKAEEPTADEPKADEPKAEESADEPVTEAPADEPVTEAPADEPVTEAPADEPVTEAPADEPVTEAPADEPVTEAPADEQAAVEETEPVTEAPTEEPAVEETEPVTEAPADEPVTEAPAGEPVTEAPADEPVTEAPADEPAAAEAAAAEAKAPKAEQPKPEPVTFSSSFSVAASVPVLVEARMDSGTNDCITYLPQDGSNSRTDWVDAGETPDTAWTAHGSSGPCPAPTLSLTSQSAVGFSPTSATTVPTGVIFTLGQMTHSNNPILGDDYFNGTLGIHLFGTTLNFPWQLWETPNGASPCAIPGTSQPCDDRITFSDTTSDNTVTIGGVQYQLNLRGFNKVGEGDIGDPPPDCPAYNAGQVTNAFITEESTTNYGCLYAELDEPGSINVVKDATPSSIAEPGGLITFDVEVQNTSDDDAVTIDSLVDDIHGNLDGQGTCDVTPPVVILAGDSYTCSFQANVTGNAGDSETDTVTASGTDDDGNPVSDFDTATVTITDVPSSINVIKDATPSSIAEPGGLITFDVEVENTSAVDTVTIDSLVDDIHGNLDGQGTCDVTPPVVILAGDSYTCSFQANVTGNAGDSETDTVTASGTDDDGNPVSDFDTATVTITDVPSSINVIKDATPSSIAEPGGLITFDVEVENTSAVDTVTIDSLVDDIHGNLDGQGTCDVTPPVVILAGDSYTCSFQANVTGNAGDSETDTVTASGTDDDGNPVSDFDTATVTITDVPSSINVIKDATPSSIAEPGGLITFDVEVENTSAVDTVTIDSLVDDIHGNLDGQGTCDVTPPVVILAGDSYTCSFQANVTGNAGDSETDTVTASGTDDDGNPVSDFDTATVTITDVPSSINVIKDATPSSIAEPGGLITFDVEVENTSAVDTVTIDSLVDDIHGNLDGQGTCDVTPPVVILAGDSYTCSFQANVTGNAGDSETDTVTASGTDDDGNPVSDFDTATVTITDVPSSINVIKDATPSSIAEPGGLITFDVEVENTSAVDTVTIDSLVDDIHGNLDGQGTCDVTPPVVILAGDSYTCSFQANVTGNAGDSETDTVTASGTDDDGNPVSDFDTATVTITDVPSSINVIKDATPSSIAEPGGLITFDVEVENTSAVDTVTIDSLVDDIHGNLDGQGTCDVTPPVVILAGDSYTCSFQANVTGNAGDSETDTVTASGTDDDGNPVSDFDTATVTITDVPSSINVIKDATPSSIAEPGGLITFDVEVENTSAVDTVTIDSLVDDIHGNLDGQGTCDVTPPVVILAGDSYTCSFQANVTGNAGDSETDTVTASGTDDDGNPVSDFDTATVTITDVPSSINVIKDATPSSIAEPGGLITFDVEVENTSAVDTVTIDSLVDDIHGNLDGQGTCDVTPPVVILAGDSYTCSFQANVTGNAGDSETDTVTASGTDDDGNPVSDFDTATVTITDVPPTVSLDKSVDDPSKPEPGGTFTFTLTIRNTSVEPVTITALTDTQSGEAVDFSACTALIGTTLAANDNADGGLDETSCSYQVVHTNTGTYPNTAEVTVEDDEQNEASDSDDESVEVTDEDVSVSIDKSVDVKTLPQPGGTFTFTLTINNDSVEPVTITALTDDNSADSPDFVANCGSLIGQTLAADDLPEPGGADELSCSYQVVHTDVGTYPNTAEVTVMDDEQNEASDSDDESVEVTDVPPTVEIDKSADVTSLPQPGGTFTFTLTIRNTSVEPVTITALTDTQSGEAVDFSACTALIGTTLAANDNADGGLDETSCSYQVVHTDVGIYPNTAVVTVIDEQENEVGDDDSESVEVTDVPPTVEIDKSADVTSLPQPGGTFTFTLTIRNTSVEPVTITALTDTQSGEAVDFSACTALIGTTLAANDNADGGLDETSCSYQVVHTDVGIYPNTAVVTVIDEQENEVGDDDSESVEVTDVPPTVEIDKSADVTSLPQPGGTFTFTLTIRNTSVEPVTITALTDTQSGEAVDFSACTALIGTTLAANDNADGGLDETSCSYQVVHTDVGIYPNTAVVTVIDEQENEVGDDDSESVEVTDVPPTVSLDKSVDDPSKPEPGGTFTFTLTIRNTSVEPVTITALTDTQSGEAVDFSACTAHIGTTLAANDNADGGLDETSCSYQVVHTDVGIYPNTAVVTVIDEQENEVGDDDSESVEVLFIEVETTPLPTPTPTPTAEVETTPLPTESLKPTNMLATTDTNGPADGGDPMGGLLNWMMWLALSALLILGTGWIIRRERLAEVKNR